MAAGVGVARGELSTTRGAQAKIWVTTGRNDVIKQKALPMALRL